MKHLCDCGEIVEAGGTGTMIATCKNCGSYYIQAHEIRPPKEEPKEDVKPRPAKRR